ncbi:MAG: hypothetical protein GEV07_11660 [Streptosporangiales bacterium]|nr:hypothetical protein [Streptosporangiales bacterium]
MTGNDKRAVDAPAPAQVFVDVTGTRRRRLRRAAYAFTVLAVGYVMLLAVSLGSDPMTPQSPPFALASEPPDATEPSNADAVEQTMEPRGLATTTQQASRTPAKKPAERSPSARPSTPRSTAQDTGSSRAGEPTQERAKRPARDTGSAAPTRERSGTSSAPSTRSTGSAEEPDDEQDPSPEASRDGVLRRLLDRLGGS